MQTNPMAITTWNGRPLSTYPLQSMTLRMELLPGALVEIALVKVMSMTEQLHEAGIELTKVVIELPYDDGSSRS